MTGGIFDDIVERPEYPDRMDYMMTPDVSFVLMIRYGMLALQLMPVNTASGTKLYEVNARGHHLLHLLQENFYIYRSRIDLSYLN